MANKLKAYGIDDDDDLEEFLEYKRQKEAQMRAAEQSQEERRSSDESAHTAGSRDIDDIFDEDDAENVDCSSKTPRDKKKISKATTDVIKDIARRTKEKPSVIPSYTLEEDDADEDEYMPSAVDYSKKIERAKQKSAVEIDKITYFEELQNKALQAKRYSYAWFTALLEMESINSGEANSRSREISISFAKVEREQGTKRTLVLKHPNQYIPQFMEDLADIPLVLHMGDQTKTVAIEVANIKSYTLRVKMKNAEDIDGIDLATITAATIDAKSPAFLLEELRKQFNEFKFEPEYNLQENLCENIEFVFGPPGTGKTTHLAANVILPIMKNSRECKVLVLTPTNKSADVLVRRIMEISKQDKAYEDWLVRFGGTGDEEIEQSPVFRDKTFDIRTLTKNVTVTTIARFPYDFFMPQGARVFLNGINWDYIIIDEASMIPLAVFNTPPTISASKDMFLNKRNIINVSISRARDYLFVVMPDDDTDNISNLRLVKRVESLIQSTDAWNEFLTPDLEELMFGDAKYLENNAFSTSHQSVNVYGLPEKIYEVRTEDTAVDVQIHRSTSKKEEVDPTLASGTVVVDEPQYMDSYDLDESLIPEELRDTAIDLPVRGAINGWCYLVPYEGKLKSHTVKKVIGMFIPQNRNGQEKMVSVSVVKEDRIIYISKDMFKIYEQSLSEPDGIQLKRTFF